MPGFDTYNDSLDEVTQEELYDEQTEYWGTYPYCPGEDLDCDEDTYPF